jgi:predicted nucleic acid-binding protein
MIVIADTSPLNYLILISEAAVLRDLYGRVVIPAAVREELTSRYSPDPVRRWMENAPQWLEVRTVADLPADFPSG